MNSKLGKPLEGIRVLDLTTALAGPFATLLLAGLGARVIKIENPLAGDSCRENSPYLGRNGATLMREHDDDVSISAINRLRNKLGITLNLKHPESRAVYSDLIMNSDVVVENFSLGVLDRLGVGYDFVASRNPALIYCSISGFGTKGPNHPGKAMDAIVQAMSGVMMTSGMSGDPPVRVGVPFADLSAPLFGVIGILAAIYQAQRTGLGQHIDVSMLGAMTMMVAGEPFDIMERCGVPQRTGLTVPRLAPFGLYPARDGYVSICAPTEVFAASLFKAIGRPELADDPRFSTRDRRVLHVGELDGLIGDFTRTLTRDEAVATLANFGVPAAAVRTPNDAVRDPLCVERGETVPLAHPIYGAVDDVFGMGLPIRFSAASVGFDQPAPELGEHNATVYCDLLGYSQERLATMKASGII